MSKHRRTTDSLTGTFGSFVRRAVCRDFSWLAVAAGILAISVTLGSPSPRLHAKSLAGPQSPAGPQSLAGPQQAPPQGQDPSLPAAIPTNQAAFEIPIQVHQHPERISEFHLLVSIDRGRSWSHYQTRQPTDQKFEFEAKQDGEYWFAMRTIDRNNQPRPIGPPRPEQIIRIDTHKPELKLDVVITQSGSLLTRWEARDPGLLAETFRLRYRQAGGLLRRSGEWQTVTLPASRATARGELAGQHDWWPEIDAETIEIQAEVLDAADNVAIVKRRMNLPKVARQLDPETPPLPRDPIQQHRLASGQKSAVSGKKSGLAWPTEEGRRLASEQMADAINPSPVVPAEPQNRSQESRSPNQANQQRVVASTLPGDRDAASAPTPGDSFLNAPRTQFARGGAAVSGDNNPSSDSAASGDATDDSVFRMASQQNPIGDAQTAGQPDEASLRDGAPRRSSDRNASNPPLQFNPDFLPSDLPATGGAQRSSAAATSETPKPTPGNSDPFNLREAQVETLPPAPKTTPLAQESLPPGEYALLTNRRQFRLTYEVDAVRPEAVEEVELWMTRDGGNHWESWATDPDRQSPFPVVVEEEGIYGFKIVVHSTEGFSGQQPQAGDLADIWVEVDTTSPQVELKSAPLGRGPDAGKLIIQWEASDRKLASRPISLYYAESLDGPWEVIAAGLENTGVYPWKVNSRTPQMLFLRIEVEDRAGNAAVHDLITPVDLRRLNPTGRIKGFDAGSSSPRSAGLRFPFRPMR